MEWTFPADDAERALATYRVACAELGVVPACDAVAFRVGIAHPFIEICSADAGLLATISSGGTNVMGIDMGAGRRGSVRFDYDGRVRFCVLQPDPKLLQEN